MHFGLDVTPPLVDVELHAHVTVVLQRKEQVIGILDHYRSVLLDVASVDRAGSLAADVQHRVVHVVGEHQSQRFEPLDDLMHVLEHTLHRLVLVHDAIEAETPDGTTTQGGEQQAPERVAQGVAKPPLQRLEPEFGSIRVVIPLGHFDQVRAN